MNPDLMRERDDRSAVEIAWLRLPHGFEEPPSRASDGAAGFDLRAALRAEETLEIAPGAWEATPTGLAIAMPRGVEAQIRPRSGLALRHGVTVLNAPGTIDADYRGEIVALLINHSRRAFVVRRGDRIAQLVAARTLDLRWREVDRLERTERSDGGFGSTGR